MIFRAILQAIVLLLRLGGLFLKALAVLGIARLLLGTRRTFRPRSLWRPGYATDAVNGSRWWKWRKWL
ncbi:MAG TPA: hypothetical protein VHH73_02860 [Verrucomicrobiae bacterium]|nr:hypothetical protein [Verrucomicrobiae bacterium]